MIFLQPLVLWGLALVAVPVVIHLLNRMRYRSLDWAAMSFLLAASRRSRRSAKLRHWLVLACRALAIAALVLAMARPLVGGWLGWALSGAPDTVLLLLDRSPSMEWREAASARSKREVAVARLTEAARATGGASRLVLIESATRRPQEISSAGVLPELTATAASDAAADIPAMLDAAVDYITANQCGRTEVWLASDLQASNWSATQSRWAAVTARLGALPQEVRVRLLALRDSGGENVAVRVTGVRRQKGEAVVELELAGGGAAGAGTRPLSVVLEGARSLVDVAYAGGTVRLSQRVGLGDHPGRGWGWVEVPPDANPRDNVSYFAFGAETHLKSVVVADDDGAGKVLQLAAAPAPAQLNQSSVRASAGNVDLQDVALVIWQSAADPAKSLETFLGEGGVVVRFPVGEGETGGRWRVPTWNRGDGVLADARDGVELPVAELEVKRRTAIEGFALAMFADGQPFVTRQAVGRGMVYAVATLPVAEWSNLGEGPVLVPMLQRMLLEGGARLGQVVSAAVGEPLGIGGDEVWTRLAGQASEAGVFQVGGRLVALNRPVEEDAGERLAEARVRELFGGVPVRFFDEQTAATARLSSEVWRWFLVAMLVLLVTEAVLTLPSRVPAGAATRGAAAEGAG